jgi:hypothetical protein
MSTQPIQTYQFDGYTVRPITEQDRPYLEVQIQADEYHRHKVTPNFFLKLLPGESAWALEDADGRVVFYFKNSPVVRMHIQFTAEADLTGKRKTMAGLIKGLAWIEAIFRVARFREIIFDADGPELYVFAKRHLGFVDAPGLLSRLLPTLDDPATQPRAVGTVPTNRLERVG